MTKLEEENDQIGGGRSFDDCDNICEWNLLFDVIFRKFMCWRFRICAQLTSGNEYFFHYKRSKWKPHFFRGSFHQPTSSSKWVGETDYPWTKVWIISFIHSHKCIRKAPENENNAYVTAEIVYLHIYKIYFGSEISKWGPSAINREFGILDCWHAIRGAPRTYFR